MTDANPSESDPVPSGAPSTSPSAGTLLRSAREAAGVHIGALAVSLKVSVRKLEALEADDLAQLPDAVFARALAASVCRTLKVDPDPVLRMLPQQHAASLPSGGQGAEVRLDQRRGPRLSPSFSLPKPVLWLTAALLVGAAVVLLLPTLHSGNGERQVPVDSAVAPAVAEPPAPTVAAPETAASGSEAVAAPQLAASASSMPAPPAAVASSASVPGEPAAIAVFTPRAASWVQVQGSDGVVQLRKTLDAGETVRINGALPLSVVIGRADAIDVQVRGKPFDLAPLAKDNVARFQIK